jgi:predicted DNA-binding transcriptional regulator AlpA
MSQNTDAALPDHALLTVDDVAHMLQVSPRTVWRLNSRSQLPKPVGFGRSVRWKQNDIKVWIDQNCPSRQDN